MIHALNKMSMLINTFFVSSQNSFVLTKHRKNFEEKVFLINDYFLFNFNSDGIISDTFEINHKGCSPSTNF